MTELGYLVLTFGQVLLLFATIIDWKDRGPGKTTIYKTLVVAGGILILVALVLMVPFIYDRYF